MQLKAIKELIAKNAPLVLDGGLGSELASRGYDLSSSLWSAGLITSYPEAIGEVHRAYLDAGARCITSASYQASIPGLTNAGIDTDSIAAVLQESVAIARRARDDFLRDNPACGYRPLVAASIGPYGAYLADGSEYRGNYGVGEQLLVEFHAQRLCWLDAAGADLLACETIPDLLEAEVLAGLLESASTPAWVSFCCTDAGHLRDGSPLADAVALFEDIPGVIAMGANCVEPGIVEELVIRLRGLVGDRFVVVYPNAGAGYDADRECCNAQETLEEWSRQASSWQRAGASMIGGCCHIGPDHIHQLAKRTTWHS